MASYMPDMEARMRAQEAMSTMMHAQLQKLERDKAESTTITEVKAEVVATRTQMHTFEESVEKRFESVDQRFEHVYEELADIKANTVEIRDLLASLVAKMEQQGN